MRSGIMLAYPFEESRLKKWNTSTVLIQPKLDGERCRAIYVGNGNVVLLSSEQHVITSLPHINAELIDWLTPLYGSSRVELDGELYIHGASFESIHSRVSRKVNIHPQMEEVHYYLFDIVSAEKQIDRLVRLAVNYKEYAGDYIHRVDTVMAIDTDMIVKKMEEYINEGYEGVIVRHPYAPYLRRRSTGIMKFKPRKEDMYKIVGYTEEVSIHGDPKGRLGAFICVGNDGTKFNVGTGFTELERVALWQIKDQIVKDQAWCMVKYQAMTSRKVPRFPVYSKVVSGPDKMGGE
jgi:DNA ligase-1